jgi:hypothetical protein
LPPLSACFITVVFFSLADSFLNLDVALLNFTTFR